jgi:hypothetical protein
LGIVTISGQDVQSRKVSGSADPGDAIANDAIASSKKKRSTDRSHQASQVSNGPGRGVNMQSRAERAPVCFQDE